MSKLINTEINQGLGYSGIVTLRLARDNKILEQATIHNAGRIPLFRFFASCLAADWNMASSTFPSRIVVFSAENDETEFDSKKWTKNTAITPDSGIMQATVPEIISDEEDNSCAVKYHFRIPTSLIGSGSASNIGKIGLYSKNVTLSDPLAYIFINSATKSLITNAANNPNVVILLDWELIISNKVITNNTNNN